MRELDADAGPRAERFKCIADRLIKAASMRFACELGAGSEDVMKQAELTWELRNRRENMVRKHLHGLELY